MISFRNVFTLYFPNKTFHAFYDLVSIDQIVDRCNSKIRSFIITIDFTVNECSISIPSFQHWWISILTRKKSFEIVPKKKKKEKRTLAIGTVIRRSLPIIVESISIDLLQKIQNIENKNRETRSYLYISYYIFHLTKKYEIFASYLFLISIPLDEKSSELKKL